MCLLYIHSEMKSSILCMGNSEDDGSYRLLINIVTDFCLCVLFADSYWSWSLEIKLNPYALKNETQNLEVYGVRIWFRSNCFCRFIIRCSILFPLRPNLPVVDRCPYTVNRCIASQEEWSHTGLGFFCLHPMYGTLKNLCLYLFAHS